MTAGSKPAETFKRPYRNAGQLCREVIRQPGVFATKKALAQDEQEKPISERADESDSFGSSFDMSIKRVGSRVDCGSRFLRSIKRMSSPEIDSILSTTML